jgi:hypothetical protein
VRISKAGDSQREGIFSSHIGVKSSPRVQESKEKSITKDSLYVSCVFMGLLEMFWRERVSAAY